MEIPDITSEYRLVEALDELKYRLKAGTGHNLEETEMLRDFNRLLNSFIARWQLDNDPHSFAVLANKKD